MKRLLQTAFALILWSMTSLVHALPLEPFPGLMNRERFSQLSREDQRLYVQIIMKAYVDLEEGHHQIEKLPDTPANKELKKTSLNNLEIFRKAYSKLVGELGISSAYANDPARVRQPVPETMVGGQPIPVVRDLRVGTGGTTGVATGGRPVVLQTPTPAIVTTAVTSNSCSNLQSETRNTVEEGECVFGGWYSTYVRNRSTNTRYCQRPACSRSADTRNSYARAQSCTGGKIACNPAVFGKTTEGSSICVEQQEGNHNTSLSCLIAFEELPNKDERLNALVTAILVEDSPAANAFNDVSRTIFNTCVCGVTPENNRLNPQYVNYMQGHRTCYSLLGMMKLYVDKILPIASCSTHLNINNGNLGELATDLGVLSNYTNRVALLGNVSELSLTNYPRILQTYRSRYAVDAGTVADPRFAGKIQDNTLVGSSGQSLDLISSIDDKFNPERARVAGWCPFTRERVPAATPTCTITVDPIPATFTAETMINARAVISPAIEGAVFDWKKDGAAVNGQRGSALSIPLGVATKPATNISLSATVAASGSRGPISCAAAPVVFAAPPVTGESCAVSYTVASAAAGGATITATAVLTAAQAGKTITYSVSNASPDSKSSETLATTWTATLSSGKTIADVSITAAVDGATCTVSNTTPTPPPGAENNGECTLTATRGDRALTAEINALVSLKNDYEFDAMAWTDPIKAKGSSPKTGEAETKFGENKFNAKVKIKKGSEQKEISCTELVYDETNVPARPAGGGAAGGMPMQGGMMMPDILKQGID